MYRNLDCCKKFESICPIHHHLCKRKFGDGGVERALSFFLHQHWKINLVSAVGREMLLCLQLYVVLGRDIPLCPLPTIEREMSLCLLLVLRRHMSLCPLPTIGREILLCLRLVLEKEISLCPSYKREDYVTLPSTTVVKERDMSLCPVLFHFLDLVSLCLLPAL